MRFVSTHGEAEPASLEDALWRGLAPDGGLYMPESIPPLSSGEMEEILFSPWPRRAVVVARHLLGDALDPTALENITLDALDFPVPLVPLTDHIRVLELFRGPTLAFKDVGARFMARLMAHFREGRPDPLTVLTATSGDTGGAVAQAFTGLPGIRVVVLFPDGRVSPRQERQFSTLGGNVEAVAVQGDFDDCQRLAKTAFGDDALRARIALTSANSINVGRLLPQTFYYFQAWAELARSSRGAAPSILFSVPSGNFGNLAAGLMAREMRLPVSGFLASTNANDEVPRLLSTGRFLARPSIPTLSTAMDVGDPSNLARILHLYGGDLKRLRHDLRGRSVSDEQTLETIRNVHERTGYVLDPHSAVGFSALAAELKEEDGLEGVLLATAHAAKFADVVEPVLGRHLPLPPQLSRCLEGERKVTPLEPRQEALRELLLSGPRAGGQANQVTR